MIGESARRGPVQLGVDPVPMAEQQRACETLVAWARKA
jgi:hypothetical protein